MIRRYLHILESEPVILELCYIALGIKASYSQSPVYLILCIGQIRLVNKIWL